MILLLTESGQNTQTDSLEELVGGVEDDEGDLAVAEHRQLVGLLHQAELPLGERHLKVSLSFGAP